MFENLTVNTSPECPAPWITQFLLIGLRCQVNKAFADYGCWSSDKRTWREQNTINQGSTDTFPTKSTVTVAHLKVTW